jgi:hypothetical protein
MIKKNFITHAQFIINCTCTLYEGEEGILSYKILIYTYTLYIKYPMSCNQNRNNVSEWCDLSTRGLLFQWTNTIKNQPLVLVWYKADLIIISLKINLVSPWYSWKIAELALNNNHSFTHSNVMSNTSDHQC